MDDDFTIFFLRSQIGIGVLEGGAVGVLDVAVTLGCVSGCCFEAVFSRQVLANMASFVGGSVFRMG